MNRIFKLSLMVATLILIDQFSKVLIEQYYLLGESTPIIKGFFSLTYVRNTGAAFGFGASAHDSIRKFLFLLIPVLVCFYLVYLIWKTRKGPLLLSLAYSLILSGAIGNLIDRFWLGYVVDFFHFYYRDYHYPAFNVADSCITVGAALLIFDFLMEIKMKKSKSN
jgi:signal peptidase II